MADHPDSPLVAALATEFGLEAGGGGGPDAAAILAEPIWSEFIARRKLARIQDTIDAEPATLVAEALAARMVQAGIIQAEEAEALLAERIKT